MQNDKVKCLSCHTYILTQIAAENGGYCGSKRCESERGRRLRAELRQAEMEKRIAAGEFPRCPLCGCLVHASKLDVHKASKCEKRKRPHPFADIFPRQDVPAWLAELSGATALPTPIPLQSVCLDSCYYPSSGFDASPMIILNGFIHSYVLADYGVTREEYLKELSMRRFKGYRLALSRDVERSEVVPHDWHLSMPQHFDEFRGMEKLMEAQQNCVPFGHWSIWKRLDGLDEHAGPPMFSLFFIAGEGIATFKGLYERNRLAPGALAIIQPGHGFGLNWTNFFNADGPFWSSIKSSGLLPEYMITGTYGDSRGETEECPFSGYQFMRRTKTKDWFTSHTIDIFRHITNIQQNAEAHVLPLPQL